MRILSTAMILIASASFANAETSEYWNVKTFACESGTLQPSRTLAHGDYVPVTEIRKAVATGVAKVILETMDEAVVALKVSGDNGGACANDRKETILTVLFSKTSRVRKGSGPQ